MKLKKIFLLFMLLTTIFSMNVQAQYEFGKTPDIHVEGNQLVDAQGHPVRFFGFMDTPSAWFNGGRWGWSYDAAGQTRCKEYFNKLFTATTDTLSGTFCNLFRLHLEPAWLDGSTTVCWFCGKSVTLYTATQIKNNPDKYGICKTCGNKTYYKSDDGKIMDPDGQEVGGEADVHVKSIAKLKTTLGSVYVPIAESANKHGMYVIMRPPGVCPGTIKVGGYYQQYLMKVWDAVTQNAKVKKYSGWLSIELANEPVRCVDAKGQDTPQALHDFFQPIVNKIRENGFEGVVWVPGTGWQANYRSYATNPIEDANLGYAVHNYTGWYGGSDESYTNGRTVSQYTNEFHNSVPILDTNPIVITEVDWSPNKKSEEGKGHVNEHGDWVDGNYGTWATGSTSKWGVLYKGLLDKYNNISMTLSATGCYLDIDEYINNKKIVPAFKNAMEREGLYDPYEGSGVACWKWYRDYYYQQHDGYSNDNITISQVNTTSIKDLVVGVGSGSYVTFNATFKSGRKGNVAQTCTYEVSDPTVAKVFHGKVIGLAPGSTDVVATYTDVTGAAYSIPFHVDVTLFPLTREGFNAAIQGGGAVTNQTAAALYYSSVKDGFAGWTFSDGVDLSKYDTLTVTLASRPTTTSKAALRIYDQPDLKGAYAEVSLVQVTEAKVPLKTFLKNDGKPLDLSKICMVGIYTGGQTTIRIKEVRLDVADQEDAILEIAEDQMNGTNVQAIFNLNGVRTDRLHKGVNIIRMADGKNKKLIIK